MVDIQIGKVVYKVANKLQDFTRAQFLEALPFLFSEEITIETRIKILGIVGSVPFLQALENILPEQVSAIAKKATDWMDASHTTCPLTSFRRGLTRYHLPLYARMSTIEAAKAQQYLEIYRKDQKEENLDLFIATLCRPKRLWLRFLPFLKWVLTKWDGDIRIRYNAVLVGLEAKAISKLDPAIKWAVVWQFNQMMVSLRKQYQAVFDYRSAGGTSQPAPLMDMIFHLSGSELGDAKTVSHTPITTVMYVLKCRLPI
jgi:hypothetical protein